MKLKLNIYSSIELQKEELYLFYFAVKNEHVAARYLNIREERENKKFAKPNKVGIIKINGSISFDKSALQKGSKVLKLGKLEHDVALG